MANLDFLFEKDPYCFKKPTIRRIVASYDYAPETSNYLGNPASNNTPQMTPMSLESDKLELSEKANNYL